MGLFSKLGKTYANFVEKHEISKTNSPVLSASGEASENGRGGGIPELSDEERKWEERQKLIKCLYDALPIEADLWRLEVTNDIIIDPFNLANLDSCYYIGDDVNLCVTTNRVVGYKGGSSGFSVRIVKGLWYREGSSKGIPVREDVTDVLEGELFITTKRIIFKSKKKSFDKKISTLTGVALTENGFTLQFKNQLYEFISEDGNYIKRLILRIVKTPPTIKLKYIGETGCHFIAGKIYEASAIRGLEWCVFDEDEENYMCPLDRFLLDISNDKSVFARAYYMDDYLRTFEQVRYYTVHHELPLTPPLKDRSERRRFRS